MAAKGRKIVDDKLALFLAGGMTIRKAAVKAGMKEHTAYRRAADPDFMARVSEIRSNMVTRAIGRMSATMTAAASRLAKLVKSKDNRTALGACRAILELTVKLKEASEFEERLAKLEAAQQQPKGARLNVI